MYTYWLKRIDALHFNVRFYEATYLQSISKHNTWWMLHSQFMMKRQLSDIQWVYTQWVCIVHSVSVHCMNVRDAMIHVELNTSGALKDLHVYYTLYMINGEVWN